jgi:hypothetical protein
MFRKPRGFSLPEFAKHDTLKYPYDLIKPEDIWEHSLIQKQGCFELNQTFYEEEIL